MIKAIVTDIEGTTTPVAFVHEVLFPFARANLSAFLAAKRADPEVSCLLRDVSLIQAGPPESVLMGWMDQDEKVTPLKSLQGLIWREGYRSGALRGALYPDVAPQLAAWSAAGFSLHVYSSGSEEAQRLLFGFSSEGDLCHRFGRFFDTRIGTKIDAASYYRISSELGVGASDILFLSDVEAELDAALSAGFATWQLARLQDGTTPSRRHRVADSFAAVTPNG